MSGDSSVTHWIHELKDGNKDVANQLWHRYFERIVRLARAQLDPTRRRIADEEDIAISVFDSFCRAAEQGRFPDLADRDSLWRLMVTMTSRKVIDQRRHDNRQRRGGGKVTGESGLGNFSTGESPQFIAEIMGDDPTPELACMLAEQVSVLLDHLADPDLQRLAVGKMEGYTNEEMAEKLGCSLRTIERRLRLIREKCRQELL